MTQSSSDYAEVPSEVVLAQWVGTALRGFDLEPDAMYPQRTYDETALYVARLVRRSLIGYSTVSTVIDL